MTKISSCDVDRLKADLSRESRVILAGDEGYEESIKRWSAAAEKPAAIVVFPKSAEDVSKTIQFTRSQELELAVKCGGHATSASSSTDGGLCIDLSLMRSILVDTKNRTIRAGGGALWRDVYAVGDAHGLACVGGAVDDTGIGGLTLGGGYGYMSGEHGLVIDNLIEIEYVLADGSIVIASANENPDLFWAARGAGAAFGIVTSFLYQAHEQKNPIWGGLLVFSASQLDSVIAAGNGFIDLNDEKGSIVVSLVNPPPNHSTIVLALVYYNGSESEAKNVFAPLLQLQPMGDTTGLMSYSSVNQLFSTGMVGHGIRHSMKGSAFTFPLAPSFVKSLQNDLSSFIDKKATAFANRGAYGNLVCIMGWRDPAYDQKCREWARSVSERAKSLFKSSVENRTGIDKDDEKGVGEYFNYDCFETSGKNMFGANFDRLLELKKRYDPHNLFSKGPKLVVAP